MKFYSKETSEKLVGLGCTSQSGMYWAQKHHSDEWMITPIPLGTHTPAFCIADFLSSEEYAIENAKKLFDSAGPYSEWTGTQYIKIKAYYHYRHELLDSPDQLKFIEDFLTNKEK